MIPLRDTIKSKTFPYVNTIIIIINILIFLFENSYAEEQLAKIFYIFGAVPSWIITNLAGGYFLQAVIPLITAAFLHGGWLHIISNMLFLWVFGDNVEDRLGHFKYLIFYILVAIIGNVSQVAANPSSSIPVIGASGAVAGILGAYYISFPRSKILALIPIFFFFTLMEVRATFFIVFWFVLQLFNGFLSLGAVGNSVAWWAHIGGFLGGILLIKIMPKKRCIRKVE